MASLKFFADAADGTVIEFAKVWNRNQSHRHNDTWGFDAALQAWVKVTRVVERKSNPSRHECDARCLNANGRTMKCECACGGKNHGRGSFICAEAA